MGEGGGCWGSLPAHPAAPPRHHATTFDTILQYDKLLAEHSAELFVKTPDDAVRATPAFVRSGMRQVHDQLLVGTSASAASLDVVPDAATAFAPSLSRRTYMPPRARSAPLVRAGGAAADAKKGAKATGGKKGAGSKKKKGTGTAAAAAAADEKKPPSEEEVAAKAALFQWLFPTMTTVEAVPSLRRLRELRTVEKVKETLAQNGVRVSTGALEESLLTPEYMPFYDCITDLPSRSGGFARNWEKSGASKHKSGKSAGRSSKKKSGGKKRKK